jgi:hypothetical protein
MHFKVLCCEVFTREICLVAADSPHTCDIEFLPKGLHDLGQTKMVARMQERVDAAQGRGYDAILLVYGLCNNGIVGLRSNDTRLVVPRAHDCISLFLGGRRPYAEYHSAHPGTYFRTTGWIEHSDSNGANDVTVQQKLGLFLQYEELVAKYGEDNAKYIQETMGNGLANYDTLAFIKMGLSCEAPFMEQSRREAGEKGWKYVELEGSMRLLQRLMAGDWSDDFLIVEPGKSVAPSYRDDVIKTAP